MGHQEAANLNGFREQQQGSGFHQGAMTRTGASLALQQ